jgi:hypothetical protein
MRTALVLLLAASAGAAAETPEQRGRRVVDEALATLGGARFLAMRDRVESGRAYSFYRESMTGLAIAHIYTHYLDVPETPQPDFIGQEERQAFGKKQEDVFVFARGMGYELTFRGARPLPDTRIEQYRLSVLHNIFYILHQRLKEPGMFFQSRGADFYNNRPVEIVDISDPENQTVTVYFDQLTKLPTRQSYFRRDPIDKSKLEEVSIFANYRDVGGGVMWPFNVHRERNGDKVFEIFADEVTINQNLNNNLFVLPPNMKILKKQQ